MTKRKEPVLASPFLIKTGMFFYGNRLVNKKLKLNQNGSLKGLKPPFLVLANHSSFAETACLTKMLLPNVANTVGAPAQFIGKNWLMHHLGVIPKRQFVKDLSVVRDIKYVLSKGRSIVLYSEAKLSVVGTQNRIMPSTAKLVKMMKVPLAVVIFDGSYLFRPRWAKNRRNVPVRARLTTFSADELEQMSAAELFDKLQELFRYDDYAYQLKERIEIDTEDLAEGLNTILYQCPHCKKEFGLVSAKNKLCCLHCGSVYEMNKYGQIEGKSATFDSVVNWYAWQRQNVVQEIKKDYLVERECQVEELPDTKKYRPLGVGRYRHDLGGITLTLPDGKEKIFPSGELYTLSFDETHLYLSETDNTYRLTFSSHNGETTKENLVCEELYKLFETTKTVID